MYVRHITPILNVSDIPSSIRWFESIGWRRCWTHNAGGMIRDAGDRDASGPATFAAVGSGEVEIFLCQNAQGSRGGPWPASQMSDDRFGGVWMSWWVRTVAELDDVHDRATRLGMTIGRPPTDEPWGVREFWLVHPDGHVFRVSARRGS